MAKVPNAVKILPKIWTAWVGRTNVTDDRQATDDRRAIAYSERELTFTLANNNNNNNNNNNSSGGGGGCGGGDYSSSSSSSAGSD